MDQDRLLSLSAHELDDLYRRSPAGVIPDGPARGVAIVHLAEPWNHIFAVLTNICAWQGKTFDAAHRRLTNRITPFHIHAITADVYRGASRLDGRECIVIDYSKTSIVAWWIRDEIREVAPSLYLGYAYCGRRRLIAFSLYFADVRRALPAVHIINRPRPV
jgi:hypothetical protein